MKNKMMLAMLASAVILTSGSAFAAPCKQTPPPPEAMMDKPPACEMPGPYPGKYNMTPEAREKMKQEHEKRKAEFDKRLNLTEAQKSIIEKNRMEDREKMKPVFEEIWAKKKQINEICNSNLCQEEKDKQVNELKSQLKCLKSKAHSLREENMKKFEEILTPAQKIEFDKMKKEHKSEKEKFRKHHNKMMPPPKCKK